MRSMISDDDGFVPPYCLYLQHGTVHVYVYIHTNTHPFYLPCLSAKLCLQNASTRHFVYSPSSHCTVLYRTVAVAQPATHRHLSHASVHLGPNQKLHARNAKNELPKPPYISPSSLWVPEQLMS